MRYTIGINYMDEAKTSGHVYGMVVLTYRSFGPLVNVSEKGKKSMYLPLFDSHIEAEMYTRVLNKAYALSKQSRAKRFYVLKFDTPNTKFRLKKDGKTWEDSRAFVQRNKIKAIYFQAEFKDS